MPPKENDRLTAAEIELVRQWITAGAPWPDDKRQAELCRRDARAELLQAGRNQLG